MKGFANRDLLVIAILSGIGGVMSTPSGIWATLNNLLGSLRSRQFVGAPRFWLAGGRTRWQAWRSLLTGL